MMPDHVPAGEADTPMPEEEVPPPAVARDPGPLHHSFQVNPTGGFDRYGYSRTAVAKEWRAPSEKVAWEAERPPNSDHLFAHDIMLSKQPNELLNPPPLTKEEKKAKAEAAKAEKDRRAGLGDGAREAEDEQTKADKWLEARSLSRRALAVRIGRKAWNYGIGMVNTPSEIAAEHLVAINAEITKVLPEDEISLTSDQAVTWLPHAVPLSKETIKWFNKVSSLSAYQSVTKDIYELLLVDELEEGRFNNLEVPNPNPNPIPYPNPNPNPNPNRNPNPNPNPSRVCVGSGRVRTGRDVQREAAPRAREALCQGHPLRPLRGDGDGERRVA